MAIPQPRSQARPSTPDRIIHVATGRFAQDGFVGTSLRDIAADLGLTMGTVYHHFHTKDALLEAVLDPYLKALANAVTGTPTPDSPHSVEVFIGYLIDLRLLNIEVATICTDLTVRNHPRTGARIAAIDRSIIDKLAGSNPPAGGNVRATAAHATLTTVGTTIPVPRTTTARRHLRHDLIAAAMGALRESPEMQDATPREFPTPRARPEVRPQ